MDEARAGQERYASGGQYDQLSKRTRRTRAHSQPHNSISTDYSKARRRVRNFMPENLSLSCRHVPQHLRLLIVDDLAVLLSPKVLRLLV
jgi:hypothetical protein